MLELKQNHISDRSLKYSGSQDQNGIWVILQGLKARVTQFKFKINNVKFLLLFIQITGEGGPAQGTPFQQDPWLSMRLPPASPFDNFLKAAGC